MDLRIFENIFPECVAKGSRFTLRFVWQAWHFVTFQPVSSCVESLSVWQAQYFRAFSEDDFQFWWQAQHFGDLQTSIVILTGKRSTLDVSCCVFFANRIVRAASSGENVQIAWQALHFVR
eukprot:s1902_g10.t1